MISRDGFDDFGNPVGRAFDLGGLDDERLRGEKILMQGGRGWKLLEAAVKERGFGLDRVTLTHTGHSPISERMLSAYTQFWIVSRPQPTLNAKQIDLIADFVMSGHGLFLLTDNAPFYADANLLAGRLIGTEFSGNRPGEGILQPGEKIRPGLFIEHPITQGINNLWEGTSICTVRPVEHLGIIAMSHDGQNSIACYDHQNQRIVLDTGFTKFHDDLFHRTAGTARYLRNIAFWLSRGARNVDYKSFTPGRENLATIDPGAGSEKYRHTVSQPVKLTYVLHWEETATLGLTIQDPQGNKVYDSASAAAPLRVDVAAHTPGDWLCWVRGVNVPRPGFPYVLTLILHKGPVPSLGSRPTTAATLKRLPVYVVMDGSSRASDYALQLEQGLRLFADRLRGRTGRGLSTNLALLLANQDGQMIVPSVGIEYFSLPRVAWRGQCGLGRALAKLNTCLAAQPADGKPLVIVLLTGAPDDDWMTEADRLRSLAAQGKANVFAISIGGYSDTAALRRLTSTSPLSLPILTQMYINQSFEWLYQIAEVIMSGLESGASGVKANIPNPPPCLKILT